MGRLTIHSCSCALLALLGSAAVAHAQSGAYISVGVDYGIDLPVSDALGDTEGFGVAFRIPRPDAWSAAWDFGSISSTLSHSLAGTHVQVGSLRVRPLMAGAAYTWRAGRFEATAAVTAGVTIVGFEIDDSGREAVQRAFGSPNAEAESNLEFAVQPKLITWVDINPRFGITASASYLRTRPELSISSAGTTLERFRVKADAVRLSAGFVVKVY